MKKPISKPANTLGNAAEQRSSEKKAYPDARSSTILLPVFFTKPVRVIFAAFLFVFSETDPNDEVISGFCLAAKVSERLRKRLSPRRSK